MASTSHFFAFIAFIALGAAAAAFFAPFFAMLNTGDWKGTLGMQMSLKTSFLEPDHTSYALLGTSGIASVASILNSPTGDPKQQNRPKADNKGNAGNPTPSFKTHVLCMGS